MFVQGSLLDAGTPAFDPSLSRLVRIDLDERCWLDHLPSWLEGSDQVFDELLERLTWIRPEVQMYDRKLEQPQLGDASAVARRLPLRRRDGRRARRAYGVTFGPCGATSTATATTAWRGTATSVLRDRSDGLVVIVSVGHRRRFLIKPAGGGPSRVRARPRPPVRDGRRLPAPVASLRAEGVTRNACRPAHQPHDATRLRLDGGDRYTRGRLARTREARGEVVE